DALPRPPGVRAAGAVDVEVAAVAGAALRVHHPLAVLARHRQVGQLGAVHDRQVDVAAPAQGQLVDVGQRQLVHGGKGAHRADASIAACAAIASSPTGSRAVPTPPRCPRWPTSPGDWAGATNAPTTPPSTPGAT